MPDNYKIDKTKPPKPIQLKDASGPHELSDDRNYAFLKKLFEEKEKDPYAKKGYNVDDVYQIMDEDLANEIEEIKGGSYSPTLEDSIYDREGNVRPVYKKNNEKGESRLLLDLKKYRPDLFKGSSQGKKDVINQYDQWNSDEGVRTLLHEIRHKTIYNTPYAINVIRNSEIDEEIFNRVMDIKFGDKSISDRAKKFIKQVLHSNGLENNNKALNNIIDYGNNMHDKIMKNNNNK